MPSSTTGEAAFIYIKGLPSCPTQAKRNPRLFSDSPVNSNNSFIDSISIFEFPKNKKIIEFININLYSGDNNSNNLFDFKFKNAFILDLRD